MTPNEPEEIRWNVHQADTDLLQAVTMPTFVLHGVHMMYGWRTFHVWMLLKVGRSFKQLLIHDKPQLMKVLCTILRVDCLTWICGGVMPGADGEFSVGRGRSWGTAGVQVADLPLLEFFLQDLLAEGRIHLGDLLDDTSHIKLATI